MTTNSKPMKSSNVQAKDVTRLQNKKKMEKRNKSFASSYSVLLSIKTTNVWIIYGSCLP